MVEATIALLGRLRRRRWRGHPRRCVDTALGVRAGRAPGPGTRPLPAPRAGPRRALARSSPEQARPRLHTAAHYARRALGDPSSVMLHDVVLTLLPQAEVDLDVERFLRPARAAMSSRSAADVDAALAAQGGPLLPEDLFGPWTEADRERLQQVHQGRPARGQALERPAPARARRRAGAPGTHACSRCPWRSPRRPAAVRATGPRAATGPERAGHLGPGQRGQRPPRPGRGRRRRLPPPAAGSGGPLRCLRSVPGRPPVPYRAPPPLASAPAGRGIHLPAG
ncbi:MAG: family transcriptional regulator [Modestobacter sp.]|nr:family transcriptional regulator [Modestobacter sp.]